MDGFVFIRQFRLLTLLFFKNQNFIEVYTNSVNKLRHQKTISKSRISFKNLYLQFYEYTIDVLKWHD